MQKEHEFFDVSQHSDRLWLNGNNTEFRPSIREILTIVMATKTKPRSGSILKQTTPIASSETVDPSPTFEGDEIAKKMLDSRNIKDGNNISDVAEKERQKRMYAMIKSSSKYKHLQVRILNAAEAGKFEQYPDGRRT